MATKKQIFNQLGSSQPVSVEYESEPIGEGAQGRVHRIVRVNNTLCATWVIKLLFQSSPQLIQRLQALVEFLHANQLNSDSLCCVPFTLLQTNSGELAIPMYYANAPDLDNGGGLPSGATLPRQLSAAYQLAHSVRRLHEKGVIIGDLALDNLIIYPQNWAVYILDIDGAQFNFRKKNYSMIANNSTKGELAPPELAQTSTYSKEMDLWGLSVVLHYILTNKRPISGDFRLARKYANMAKKIDWPPAKHLSHLDTLAMLGEPIKAAFLKSFNEGRTQPSKRLSASKWESLLKKAQEYVYQCNCLPDEPYVALQANGKMMMECRRCQSPLMAHR